MDLPNLSFLTDVAKIRYIQNSFEGIANKNPDDLAGLFLSRPSKIQCWMKFLFFKSKIRSNPWYWYLLARTFYYDELFLSCIFTGFKTIVNIGCGADTRAIRFRRILNLHEVQIIELDQPDSIAVKKRLVPSELLPKNFLFSELDLNSDVRSRFLEILGLTTQRRTLVLMEGVSPYIDRERFRDFLGFLASALPSTSLVAYDFKIAGIDDSFGASEGNLNLFRLSDSSSDAVAFHEDLGLDVVNFTRSQELIANDVFLETDLFRQDCLIQVILR